MRERLSKSFHSYVKRLVGRTGVPTDHSLWPEEWQKAVYKNYPRLPQIQLPNPEPSCQELEKTLELRFSTADYKGASALSLSALSSLLHYAAGIRPTKESGSRFRFYPSGGALYPLEIYVGHEGSEELRSGIYHYAVATHSLEFLVGKDGFEMTRDTFTYPFAKEAPTFLILTSVWERTFSKYKDFGYPAILLEAGHLSQNILLLATALGLKNRPYIGFKYEALLDVLDLDHAEETLLSMILLGA